MKKIVTFWVSLIIFTHCGFCQNKNIMECLKLIDFDPDDYLIGEIFVKIDTIIDLKAGYFRYSLCEAAKFNNADGTITLAITGYYTDMQCSNYHSYFYEISKSGDSFIPIKTSTIIPSLDYRKCIIGSKPIEVLKKYLPEIKDSYLGTDATLENVLNEVYDFRIIIPREGTNIKVTCTLCDYIPNNVVSIPDWNIIEDNIDTVEFIYDKQLKQFKNISNKNKNH